MITIFEDFDNNNTNPNFGDYVVVKCDMPNNKNDENYINNTIGVIVNINYSPREKYRIKFKPGFILTFYRYQIVAFSKYKEDIETYLTTKNFNL